VITVLERHGQTGRQTDGRTGDIYIYCGTTALCVASRGKNCVNKWGYVYAVKITIMPLGQIYFADQNMYAVLC